MVLDTQTQKRLEAAGLQLEIRSGCVVLAADGFLLKEDFSYLLPRVQTGRLQRELLIRAAKTKMSATPRTAIDATAGLGEDAFLLAAAGYSVTLYERDPIIALLLRDALCRAAKEPKLSEIVSRMQLNEADSTYALRQQGVSADVIFLDPMFPLRTKSASAKKKFQVLRLLEQPSDDDEALLQSALDARPSKVVIKRSRKDPYLAAKKPHYSLAGTTIRYDCFSFPQRSAK